MLNKAAIRIDEIKIEYVNSANYRESVVIPQRCTVKWSVENPTIQGEQSIDVDMIDIDAIRDYVIKKISG